MAFTVSSIMNGIYSNPDVAAIGILAGYLLAKAQQMRKRRNQGFGGGGF